MVGITRARRGAIVFAFVVFAAFTVAAAPGTASDAPRDTEAVSLGEQRRVALEAEQQKATELEEQRLLELTAAGNPTEVAAEMVRAEQRQAATEIRQRIIELSAQGMTIDEIAAATPGMVVVSAPDNNGPELLSRGEDMVLQRASITFARQCGCYTVESGWERERHLESGKDVVGIRLTKRVSENMGGSISYCSSSSNCDTIGRTPGVDWEEPAGVAHSFDTFRGSHHGIIAFSYKGNLGSVQPYTHYHHAWETVRINGVSISPGGIGVNWQYDQNAWSKQTAGRACGQC